MVTTESNDLLDRTHPVGTLQQQRALHHGEMSADYRLKAVRRAAQHAKHRVSHVVVPQVVVVITRALFTLAKRASHLLIQS